MDIKWKDVGYGCHRLNIPGGFELNVVYSNAGYEVSFEQTSLANKFVNLNEAKRCGEKLAIKKLETALQFLKGAA